MRRILPVLFIVLIVIGFAVRPTSASHAHENAIRVEVTDSAGNITTSIYPFPDTYRGDASIAAADLGSDGTKEILIGSGHGASPTVYVYRQDGSKIGEFLAYDAGYGSGVNVAACDIDGDGTNEIVTGTLYGGGPHIRVFNNMGVAITPGFFAYDELFRGGVNVACGDLDQDGKAEIVTAPGRTGGPHVKIFTGGGELLAETFAGSATENSGSYVWAEGSDIKTARIVYGTTSLTTFTFTNDQLTFSSAKETSSPLRPDSVSLSNGSTAQLTMPQTTHLFDEDKIGTGSGKRIVVDISEQMLYAYENGAFIRGFLVSTGRIDGWTPVGQFAVTDKLLSHDYAGSNYFYPDVMYNLRFYPRYYIHTAYWHDNFGHVMSGGCVNTSLEDARWTYEWAEVGTIIDIIE